MHIGGIWSSEAQYENKGNAPGFLERGLHLEYDLSTTNHKDESQFFVMEGQIFDSSIPELLADLRRLETAYGHYAYVHFNRLSGEVRIGTDLFGFYPLYYAFEQGRFIFGSFLGFVKSKLKHKSPDYEAWEELLTLGDIIGEKSTIKQVKRLPEGTQIRIKLGQITFHRYWSPEIPNLVDEVTYIRENNRLLDEAMALTSSQERRKIVLLSGGEDSRRIALAAARGNVEVDFFTQETVYKRDHDHYVDADCKLAAKLAEMLGRPHFIEPLPSYAQSFADSQTRDACLGFECASHEWILPLARKIPQPSIVYDGIVGDVTINGHYAKYLPAGALDKYKDIDALANMICAGQEHDWLEALRQKTGTTLAERVRQSLASYPESPHRLNLFSIFNHNRRKIATVAQLFGACGHWTCYPFLYYPLFVQSLSLDPRRQVDRHFQRECMAALSPEIVSIPTTRQPPVPEEWLIPLDKWAVGQHNYMLRHFSVSEEALELFPSVRTRYRALEAYRQLTNGPFNEMLRWPLERFGWFMFPLARFSAFLKWLES